MGTGLDDTAATGVACLQARMAAVRRDHHELFLAVARLESDGTAIAAGYRSTKRFLQDVLRINAAEAGHLIHHGDWTITMIDGRPWYRPPTWIDPDQRLRPGGRFPVPQPA